MIGVKPQYPDVDIQEDGTWRTGEEIVINDGNRRVIRIPAGSKTDFASLPRVARLIWRTHGRHTVPAIVHDALYLQQDTTRAYADKLFLRLMKMYGVGWVQRHLFYGAVRANVLADIGWGSK